MEWINNNALHLPYHPHTRYFIQNMGCYVCVWHDKSPPFLGLYLFVALSPQLWKENCITSKNLLYLSGPHLVQYDFQLEYFCVPKLEVKVL
jgi:hypothetical protein